MLNRRTSVQDVADLYNYDKKEYLKNRFKRDFLQYSLLQKGSLPAKEIVEKL